MGKPAVERVGLALGLGGLGCRPAGDRRDWGRGHWSRLGGGTAPGLKGEPRRGGTEPEGRLGGRLEELLIKSLAPVCG